MEKMHIVLIAVAAAILSASEGVAREKAWMPENAVREVRDTKSGFVHPGIGLTRDDLLVIAKNVRDGVEPWKSSYDALVKRDHRFSMKPRIFTRRGENLKAIDSPDFDNRCAWDSQSALCQAVLYVVDGDERHRGFVELLPALPKAWPSGSVKGLRARGGWTVDFAWKDGVVTECTVRASVGGKLRLKINGKISEYDVKPGATVRPKTAGSGADAALRE